MSQENLEIVRRNVEAYWRGDIDAVIEDLAEDVECDLSAVRGPYRGVYRGREDARKLLEAIREVWATITPLSTEYIVVEDKVVLAARGRFRGRGSGVTVEGGGMAAVYTLRNGKIVRYQVLQDKAEALQAAGLRE